MCLVVGPRWLALTLDRHGADRLGFDELDSRWDEDLPEAALALDRVKYR